MMKIISSEIINGVLYSFYEGLDFNKLKEHPIDGSNGYIICFIKNWLKYELEYNRSIKISNLLYNNSNNTFFDWNELKNNYLNIYQCDNIDIHKMFEYIKENINIINSDNVWISFTGLSSGAWNLTSALSYKTNYIYSPYIKKREL